MQNSRLKIKRLTAAIGTCLALGAAAPMWADTDLMVENDGLTLSAFVNSSSQDVLSMSIRIVGPDGFVFEERVEGGAINWIPKEDLADGVYHWEAWTVTAKPQAQMREVLTPMEMEELDDSALQARIDNVPLERLFKPADKDIATQSGSFRVSEGWLEDLNEEFGEPLSQQPQPNAAQRLIGFLLDSIVPSAHAQTTTSDIRIQKNTPSLYLDSTASGNGEWRFWLGQSSGDIYLQDVTSGSFIYPFRIEQGAPTDSLRVRSNGDVGLGTSTPSEPLHISDSQPRIRLEDSTDAQSWYIKAANAGNFEIGESRTISAFRIYPETPEGSVQVRQFQATSIIGGSGTPRGRLGINTFPQAELHLKSTPGVDIGFGPSASDAVIRLERSTGTAMQIRGGVELFVGRVGGSTGVFRVHGDAPNDSLRVASDGNVGVGTSAPDFSVDVRSTTGLGQIRVTETNGSNGLTMFALENSGHPRFRLRNADLNSNWDFRTAGSGASEQFQITNISDGQSNFLFRLFKSGDLEVEGDVSANGVLLTSTRAAKTDFAPLDANDVLERLSNLEISQWRYKHEAEGTVHFGPVAEEFHDVFGLSDGKHLNMIDTNGITFAAIQALYDQNQQLMTQNSEFVQRLERLESATNL